MSTKQVLLFGVSTFSLDPAVTHSHVGPWSTKVLGSGQSHAVGMQRVLVVPLQCAALEDKRLLPGSAERRTSRMASVVSADIGTGGT